MVPLGAAEPVEPVLDEVEPGAPLSTSASVAASVDWVTGVLAALAVWAALVCVGLGAGAGDPPPPLSPHPTASPRTRIAAQSALRFRVAMVASFSSGGSTEGDRFRPRNYFRGYKTGDRRV